MIGKESGKPAGPFSIGRALEIPSGSVNDDLRLAVEAIDRVHGVGLLPRIPMTFAGQLRGPGMFFYDPMTGEPIRIFVNPAAPYPTFVALHEIGHFVDLAALGSGPSFGSTVNSLMLNWLSAVTSSVAFRNLAQRSAKADDRLLEQLVPDELWARSYAQYIAFRSGVTTLVNMVARYRTSSSSGLHIPLYWDDNDFETIARAIDLLFINLGWRK